MTSEVRKNLGKRGALETRGRGFKREAVISEVESAAGGVG